ncbi:MAG: right-handed parallel beta-helix repeat-containing protein [Actinomycetota bacterium]
MRLGRVTAILVLLVGAVFAAGAGAHEERKTKFPKPPGAVPRYRHGGPYRLVCNSGSPGRISRLPSGLRAANRALYRECRRGGFRNIQAAVNSVTRRRTRILVLPGRYLELPSRARLRGECADFADRQLLTHGEQRRCPHAHNLIAIFGDGNDSNRVCDGRLCELQIEGTGATPRDVIIDGHFKKLNVIRADRADGVYFRNFTVQQSTFNALYVIETDGFAIDRVLGRWNDEYAFLTFASDHGLYKRCEAYGNGDSGIYPGSAAPHYGARPSIEIRRCRSHHNLIGYSGTAGNSVYAHHNRFYKNSAGATMDSFFPNHPGLPQNNAVFRHNKIFSNNKDYYRYYRDGTCDKPYRERGYKNGVVCPAVPVPIGTGIMVAGGNQNLFASNWIYDNWRYGTMLFWVPAAVRGENDPDKQYDTSHFNRYIVNRMGVSPAGRGLPNGTDFWWDEEGAGNCWERNRSPGGVTSDPATLPDCDQTPVFSPGNSDKQGFLAPCATWSRENYDPPGCDWTQRPDRPGG